jgi:hypothetical protein
MNELVYDMLDKIVENVVPNRTHELLHVNCRTAFVETAVELLEREIVKPTVSNVRFLTSNWENVLYSKYSTLN